MAVAETRSVLVVVVVVALMRVPRGLLNSSNLAAHAMFAHQFPRDHRYFNHTIMGTDGANLLNDLGTFYRT